MPTYRVRPGVTFGPAGCIPAGQTVTLTEYEAGGFLDKLELVSTSSTSEEATQPDAPVTLPAGDADEESQAKPTHKRTKRG